MQQRRPRASRSLGLCMRGLRARPLLSQHHTERCALSAASVNVTLKRIYFRPNNVVEEVPSYAIPTPSFHFVRTLALSLNVYDTGNNTALPLVDDVFL
jgi:hypothetical protein